MIYFITGVLLYLCRLMEQHVVIIPGVQLQQASQASAQDKNFILCLYAHRGCATSLVQGFLKAPAYARALRGKG